MSHPAPPAYSFPLSHATMVRGYEAMIFALGVAKVSMAFRIYMMGVVDAMLATPESIQARVDRLKVELDVMRNASL